MAESRTKAAEPHGGGDKKILGLEPKTFVIVAIVVVVGGYLYLKSKSQTGQGTGQGQQQQKQPVYISPTGMSNGQFSQWHRHHTGHKGR